MKLWFTWARDCTHNNDILRFESYCSWEILNYQVNNPSTVRCMLKLSKPVYIQHEEISRNFQVRHTTNLLPILPYIFSHHTHQSWNFHHNLFSSMLHTVLEILAFDISLVSELAILLYTKYFRGISLNCFPTFTCFMSAVLHSTLRDRWGWLGNWILSHFRLILIPPDTMTHWSSLNNLWQVGQTTNLCSGVVNCNVLRKEYKVVGNSAARAGSRVYYLSLQLKATWRLFLEM